MLSILSAGRILKGIFPANTSHTATALLGFDYTEPASYRTGGLAAFTYTPFDLHLSAGSGEILSGYTCIYGGLLQGSFDINGAFLASYSSFEPRRVIRDRTVSVSIDRIAHGDHGAFGIDGRFDCGYLFEGKIRPYAAVDLASIIETSFTERRAGGLDLHVEGSNTFLWRGEAGVFFCGCPHLKGRPTSISFSAAYAYEDRVLGREYDAQFKGTPCTFTVKGLHPNRNLFLSEGEFDIAFTDRGSSVSLWYRGEVGGQFFDWSFGVGLEY